MVSIIKNQLLKHLSRYTKNLSADKINLSTFKGEGELSNLELEENVLTELLELPSWLQLKRAWCNRVLFRIPWTKLKTVPIYLNLDEVNIIVETCEELRTFGSIPSSYSAVPGKYSFIHKVIDGITINVNTVYITFNSPAFTASVQISRIIVESKTPQFNRGDLRWTRLKNSEKGQILIFKELEWQTVRIEAKSTVDKQLTPLRLLTNHARCRITIKKRLSDCFIMGSRLVLILDDLLWVLTDSQLKAALHFLDSLAGLVQKATEVTRKEKAARKLEVLPEYQAQIAQEARVNTATEVPSIKDIFRKLDVIETSYHFLSQNIVLHLCDDPGNGRSCHPNLKDGGALQISLYGFQVDYYPYHLAVGDRKHWPKYKEGTIPHIHWLEQSLSQFRSKFIDLIDKNHSQHTPLSRSSQQNQDTTKNNQESPTSQGSSFPDAYKKLSSPYKREILKQLAKLMTTCIILRIEDFCLYKVTTSGKKVLKEFISGDRDHISLPEDANILHAEFTYYYYPGNIAFPLPPPKFYAQVNPTQIYFDLDSCLWFNSFLLNLHQSLISTNSDVNSTNLMYIDVKIEAILPRIILESNIDHHTQRDRPKSLHLQITRATITNVRSLEHSSRADLAKCVDSFYMGSLFFGSEFPSQPDDFYIVTQKFLDHIAATDNVRSIPDINNFIVSLNEHFSRELLWTEAKDVWCINLDPLWVDFFGARSVGNNRAIPFLDAVPVTLWIHLDLNSKQKSTSGEPKTADLHALAYISNLVSIQINHYQYLFLLRMAEDLAELTTFLALDSNRILNQENNKSIAIGALIPQVELTFVMPSQCPGKESSGGDLESVLPDSSSIADDILAGTGSGTTLWQNADVVSVLTDSSKKNNYSLQGVNEITVSYDLPVPNENVSESININSAANGIMKDVQCLPATDVQSFQQPTTLGNMNMSNLNTSFSSMKKGFNNLISSIDSALKPSPDDASDTVSIRSDASSDSDNYVVVTNYEPGCIESMFKVQGVNYNTPTRNAIVEMASEVIEEENTVTTPSEHSFASTYKRRDLVSIVTFKLNKLEILQQSAGFASNLKIQISNVISEECGSIPWDEFQSKFNSRSRAWMDIPSYDNTKTIIKLRLDHDLTLPVSSLIHTDVSNKSNMRKIFKDTINIQVKDLELNLAMSTITGLTDLIEDEIYPEQLPMQIVLENIRLHIIEDRPPNNITSPGPIPIHLKLDNLFINKDAEGVFQIIPLQKTSVLSNLSEKEENDKHEEIQLLRETVKQIKTDNDELKRRLIAFDRISEENRILRKSKEEADVLRAYLSSAQDDIAKLIEDKKSLLDSLQKMEEILKQRDSGRQWNSKR